MTANEANNEFSLLRLVPAVLRARGFRLYTEGSRRLVDLWLNGGAAVLGHTPPLLLREIKNTASRGLFAPFPHFLEGRFINALSRLFPGRAFRLYAAAPAELEALVKNGNAALWRPFLDGKAPLSVAHNAAALIPVLPGITGWRGGLPLGLCIAAVDSAFMDNSVRLPAGDFLPPVLLAAAGRGIYSLAATAPSRAKPAFPRIIKAIKDSPWQRQGIYLTFRRKADSETWSALFRVFLDAGFLLPPVPDHPLILPGELSPGEESKLAETLKHA